MPGLGTRATSNIHETLTVKPPPKISEGSLDAGVRAELTVLGM